MTMAAAAFGSGSVLVSIFESFPVRFCVVCAGMRFVGVRCLPAKMATNDVIHGEVNLACLVMSPNIASKAFKASLLTLDAIWTHY